MNFTNLLLDVTLVSSRKQTACTAARAHTAASATASNSKAMLFHKETTCFIVLGVLEEVFLEDAHEDGGQKPRQQQHCHTRVDDAEPVDLQFNAQPAVDQLPG